MIAISVGEVKPTYNLAAAEEVAWHVSAEVGPVPPYGDGDILGSDTASKLIVNQPNGNTEVALTGVMNGLNPNTVYTVLLSKGYFTTPVYWPGLFTSTIPTFTFTTDMDQEAGTLLYVPRSSLVQVLTPFLFGSTVPAGRF
jgi:hypothetical protein